MTWAICLVVPNKEMMCCLDMERLGINSYLPIGTKLTRPKKKRKCVRASFYPFPGYIFVEAVRDHYMQLSTVRGFRRVIFNNIRDELVNDVKSQQNVGLFDIEELEKPRKQFHKNDSVKIIVGPLVGLTGVVDKDTKGNFWAFLDVSGMRVKIFVDFIEKM